MTMTTKRSRKPAIMTKPEPATFATTIALIKTTIDSHLSKDLLDGTYHLGKNHGVAYSIHWFLGAESPKTTRTTSMQYVLTITARHGAFGEAEIVKRRTFWSLDYITDGEITNALFAALSVDGSPYEFVNDKWIKRMEVM